MMKYISAFTYLIPQLLLITALLLPGCSSLKKQAASPGQEMVVLGEVSEIDQLKSTALLIDGSRQKALGNWSKAIVHYHDAIGMDPGNDAAHFELARLHVMEEQLDDALAFALTAARLDPYNYFYQNLLAEIYLLQEDLPAAIGIFSQLVERYPQNLDFSQNLASSYLFNNQPEKALEVFDHIESILGFSEQISITRQKVWMAMGRFDMAIEEAERLVATYPEETVYYEMLAEMYMQDGQEEKANEIYRQMLRQDPDDPYSNLLMADYYRHAGNMDAAFVHLEKAFDSPGLDAESKAHVVFSYYQLTETDTTYLEQAMSLCRRLIDTHPDDPESYLIYGDFLLRAQQYKEAQEAYLEAARLDPSNFGVWQQILNIDTRLTNFENLKKHSEKALEYFFEQPVLFLFNGLANIQLKNYEEAASMLEYGLATAAADKNLKTQILSLLGDTYNYLGQYELSDKHFEQALKLNPDNATAMNNYSYHLAVRKEKLDLAEELSRQANRLQPDNPAMLDTYGWIMYQKGDYAEAEKWIRESIKHSDDPSSTVLEHYGDVLYQLNRKEEAVSYWKKALEKGMGGSEFLKKKVNDKTLYE
jgi:tetratricopeptide (TPR) repeat protein